MWVHRLQMRRAIAEGAIALRSHLILAAALFVACLNAKGSGAAAQAPERPRHTALLDAHNRVSMAETVRDSCAHSTAQIMQANTA